MTTDPPPARRSLAEWEFTVLDSALVAPRMMRIGLSCPDLARFDYAPGQALRIAVPCGRDGVGERDYTIRGLDRAAGRMDVDVLLHGDTPGPRWARSVVAGDRVRARGPRSPVRLWPGRDWYLLAGDETAMPAILHMLETLPAGATARAFVEIADPEDRMEAAIRPGAALTWVLRGRGGSPHAEFIGQVLEFPRPPGQGQACVIGQTGPVQAIRRGLMAAGMAREDIAAEGYWRPGRTGGVIESLD